MQLEGNFPDPEERPSKVRFAVLPVGAGLAPAPLSPSPLPLPAGEGRGEGRAPNHATLHSSSTSLPAVDQIPFLPDDAGADLVPAGSPEPDDTEPAQDPVQDSCTLVQGSLIGVLR
jgi:hypothetical protein